MWKPIKDFESYYEISDEGEIRSLRTGLLLKPQVVGFKHKQYLVVFLCVHGCTTRRMVHLLVLETFVGPRPNGMFGIHRNDDRTNNKLDNLEWNTPRHNAYLTVANGHSNSKLTFEQCEQIIIRRKHESGSKLANEFGVSEQTICDIVKGRRHSFETWKLLK